LHGIANDSGSEAEGKSLEAFFCPHFRDSLSDRLVLRGVDLFAAFHQIHWGDSSVSQTARHGSSNHTFYVVAQIVLRH
jgi:hypothetical protein